MTQDTPYIVTLDRDALTLAGVPGWPFGYRDRVRFYELDALNHVNNVTFLRWFETVRVRYLREYGLNSYSHTDADPQTVVRQSEAEYLAPMHQDEDYIVTAKTTLVKPSSMVMAYAVHASGTLKATGSAVLVSLEQDGKTRRPHLGAAVDRMIRTDGAEKAGF